MSCDNKNCNFKWTLKHGVNFMNEPIEVSTTNFEPPISSGVDRFDLEDAIMHQLDITDNLEVLVQNILDNGAEVDRVVNVLNGIIELHKMKNEQLFDIFTAVFELDEYSK